MTRSGGYTSKLTHVTIGRGRQFLTTWASPLVCAQWISPGWGIQEKECPGWKANFYNAILEVTYHYRPTLTVEENRTRYQESLHHGDCKLWNHQILQILWPSSDSDKLTWHHRQYFCTVAKASTNHSCYVAKVKRDVSIIRKRLTMRNVNADFFFLIQKWLKCSCCLTFNSQLWWFSF